LSQTAAVTMDQPPPEEQAIAPEAEAIALRRCVMAPWQARCIQGYIAANLHGTIRVMDLVRVLQFSPNRFDRVFKESFGCTPHQYVMRRRIERAQSLLLMSDDSLSQIAAECGFVNPSHLSNLFHRIVGEPPGRWRRIQARRYEHESQESLREFPPQSGEFQREQSIGAGDVATSRGNR
jgi:AraC family transcriptional regulator